MVLTYQDRAALKKLSYGFAAGSLNDEGTSEPGLLAAGAALCSIKELPAC